MADYRYQTQAPGQVGARAEIDQGLRSYMLGVYNYMALGIAVTGNHCPRRGARARRHWRPCIR